MIQSIQLKNFRTHKKIKIDFDPYVTSIIGASYTGKSTILRALKWVALNKPLGDSIINWNTYKAMVKLLIDGHTIIRKKGKGINLYKLDGRKLEAFSTDVPEPILKILNISPVNFNQNQHDTPFWFSDTAGEVSRQLNSIVNLGVIDDTLANIASELRRTKSEIDIYEERLKELLSHKRELKYAKELDTDLMRVEDLENQYNENCVKRLQINNLLKQVVLHRANRDFALETVLRGNSAVKKADLYIETQKQAEKLKNLISNYYIQKNIIDNRPPSIKPITQSYQKYVDIKQWSNKLYNLIERIKDCTSAKTEATNEAEVTQVELKKKMGKRCPLCGNQIKE